MSTTTISLPLLDSNSSGSNGIGILQSTELQRRLERMAARVAIMAGNQCDWPPAHHDYLGRKTTAISYTLGNATAIVTVDGANLCGGTDDVSGNTYADPFNCVLAHSPQTDYIPGAWTFVFDHPLYGWSQCIKCDVISWTNTKTITINAAHLYDAIKARIIPDASVLVGWGARVIRQGGTWRSDRVQQFANDPEFANGIVQSLAANTNVTPALPASPATHVFRHPGLNPLNANGRDLRGCDFRFYSDDGRIQNATISATSTAQVAYISGTNVPSVGTAWAMGTNGFRDVPGQVVYPWFAYQGIGDYFDTQDFRTDTIAGAYMPVQYYSVPTDVGGGAGVDCENVNVPAFGSDYITDYTGQDSPTSYTICGRGLENIYAPNLFKGFAGLQQYLVSACSSFYENKDYTGLKSVPNLNPAETARIGNGNLAAAGADQTLKTYLTTTGDVVGTSGTSGAQNNQIYITPPAGLTNPCNVYYSIHTALDGYNAGFGLLSGSVLASVNSTAFQQQRGTNDAEIGDNARTVLLWPGFTKMTFNEVRSMYDQPGFFMPDIITPDVGPPFAQDPPTPISYTSSGSFGVGSFKPRAKSTNCWDRTFYTADPTAVQGFAIEGSYTNTAFVTGHVYRFVGDNFWHPVCYTGSGFLKGGDPLSPYYGVQRIGTLSPTHQPQRMALLSGTVSLSGTNWCRIPACDWFTDPVPSGVLYTLTGTATAGSTTGFTDSTLANLTNPLSSYIRANRFPGYGGPYVSFPVEIDHGAGTWRTTFNPNFTEARLVATGTTNGVFTWLTPMSASANGKPYRFREPRNLHPVFGRTMHFSPGTNTGVAFTATNVGTCGDMQFFNAGTVAVSMAAGWQCTIDYPLPGGVWRYNGTASTAWSIASGSDTARIGVISARDFTKNANFNLESFRLDYGWFDQGTVVGQYLVNEYWAFRKVLDTVPVGWAYTNKSSDSDSSPAINQITAGSGSGWWGDGVDGSDPTDMKSWPAGTNITKTFQYWNGSMFVDFYTGGSMEGEVAAIWGLPPGGAPGVGSFSASSVDGAVPQATSSIDIGQGGNEASAGATKSYVKVSPLNQCRDITGAATVRAIVFGQIDAFDSAPDVATCGVSGGVNPTGNSFAPGATPFLYHKWALGASGTISGGTNNAYIGPVGDTTQPAWPSFVVCPNVNPSDAPVGQGAGGWYAGNLIVLATYVVNDT